MSNVLYGTANDLIWVILFQNSILAIQDSWAWISKLMKCAETHIQNAADYQKVSLTN
jgi:hypothetical protein